MASKNNGFGNGLYLQIPRVKNPIPLFIVFRALGVLSDEEICKKIVLDITDESVLPLMKCLQASIVEANKYITQDICLKFVTSNVMYTPMNMDKETGARKNKSLL